MNYEDYKPKPKYCFTPRIRLGIDESLSEYVTRRIKEGREKMTYSDMPGMVSKSWHKNKFEKMKQAYKILNEFNIDVPVEIKSYLEDYIKNNYGVNRVCLSCWFDD